MFEINFLQPVVWVPVGTSNFLLVSGHFNLSKLVQTLLNKANCPISVALIHPMSLYTKSKYLGLWEGGTEEWNCSHSFAYIVLRNEHKIIKNSDALF